MAVIDHEALRDWLEAKGWDGRYNDFAAEVGISPQYLSDIVGGRRTLKRRPDLIRRIADVLDVAVTRIESRVSA